MTGAVIERYGRIRVSANAQGPRRYLLESLLTPHGWRERIAIAFGRLRPDGTESLNTGESGVPVGKTFLPAQTAVAAVAEKDVVPGWLQVEDYEGSRARAIVFLFPSAESERPFAVAKVRMGGDGVPLRRERDALHALSVTPLRETVPQVRSYAEEDGVEVLVLSAMAGASIYREMRSAVVPQLEVGAHFAHARRWLSEFQRGRERGAHGDFWGRNILIDGSATAVVDWENFDPAGDPLDDVFHFGLTYALAFRWDSRERLDAVEKFRRAFAERNVVSRAMRDWLAHFALLRGLPQVALRRRMGQWLGSGAEGVIARPRLTAGEWTAMLEVVDGRTQCVFSG